MDWFLYNRDLVCEMEIVVKIKHCFLGSFHCLFGTVMISNVGQILWKTPKNIILWWLLATYTDIIKELWHFSSV